MQTRQQDTEGDGSGQRRLKASIVKTGDRRYRGANMGQCTLPERVPTFHTSAREVASTNNGGDEGGIPRIHVGLSFVGEKQDGNTWLAKERMQ